MILNSTRLCLAACRFLAEKYYDKVRVSATEIADKYNMNQRALMPNLNRLVKAHILNSQVGGRNSGFIFAKDPKTISINDIIITLQGSFEFNCCADLMCDFDCEIKDSTICPIATSIKEAISLAESKLNNVSVWEFSQIKK